MHFLANDLGHDTQKFTDSIQGGKHQTSDIPPFNPSYKGILQTWKATWRLANKGHKVRKEGHGHLLLMGLKIFYLEKVTARQG